MIVNKCVGVHHACALCGLPFLEPDYFCNNQAQLFPLLLDRTVLHLHMNSSKAEGPKSSLQKTTMLALAVTHHNLPESIAVGVVYADWLSCTVGSVLCAVGYTVMMALG